MNIPDKVRVVEAPHNPSDFHVLFAKSVNELVEDYGLDNEMTVELLADYASATVAVKAHEWYEEPLREDPYVIYNPNADNPAFLFKMDNNGTTLIVSTTGMLDERINSEPPVRIQVRDIFGLTATKVDEKENA